MPVNQKADYTDPGFILSAMTAWVLAALGALALASFILWSTELGGGCIGYISSALSFLAALFAGAAAGRVRKAGALYTAALAAAAIVTVLLTVGFMIKGASIEASAVISVVSFTFAGCLSGALLFGDKKQARHAPPRP